MKNNSAYAAFSLVFSFLAFRLTGALASGAGDSAAYILSWTVGLFSALVFLRRIPRQVTEAMIFESSEDECEHVEVPHSRAADDTECASRRVLRNILIFVTSLSILLAANFVFALIKGAGSPRAISARVIFESALLKPFCEEALFRGAYPALCRRGEISPVLTTIACSAAFAAIHSGSSAIFALFAGIVLSLAEERSHLGNRGFLLTFAVHGTYNLTLCCLSASL